jgi:hypothetical protein
VQETCPHIILLESSELINLEQLPRKLLQNGAVPKKLAFKQDIFSLCLNILNIYLSNIGREK